MNMNMIVTVSEGEPVHKLFRLLYQLIVKNDLGESGSWMKLERRFREAGQYCELLHWRTDSDSLLASAEKAERETMSVQQRLGALSMDTSSPAAPPQPR